MQIYSTDQEILQTAIQWLKEDHHVALVTVLKTWGSSPRPAGSMLIMRSDGLLYGSVSGGCIEEDLLQRYMKHELAGNYPTIVDYGVNRDDAVRFGLPCGGRLELLVENLNSDDELSVLLANLQQQKSTTRCIDLQTGEVRIEDADSYEGLSYTDESVRKVFGPQWTMLLIGAGHLSQYVSQMALMLNYRVVVCDPREEYAHAWLQEGTELTSMMPDEAVQHYIDSTRSIVIALTHDPKLDDMALLDALDSPAFYVGAIGSKKNCDARRSRLSQMGVSNGKLEQLHAPVGLPIGSHTPPEIALSIMADVTRLRNMPDSNVQNEMSAS